MKTVTAREAKNRFGQLIDDAQRGPVTVEKNGRPFVVVQSRADARFTIPGRTIPCSSKLHFGKAMSNGRGGKPMTAVARRACGSNWPGGGKRITRAAQSRFINARSTAA